MHFSTPIPFEELVCWFNAADICWTTPLRDGPEPGREGIRSPPIAAKAACWCCRRFTGVAAELQHAVPTNPYASDSLADSIDQALGHGSGPEQRARMAAMYENVCKYDIGHWAEHIFKQFDRVRPLGNRFTSPAANAAE